MTDPNDCLSDGGVRACKSRVLTDFWTYTSNIYKEEFRINKTSISALYAILCLYLVIDSSSMERLLLITLYNPFSKLQLQWLQ